MKKAFLLLLFITVMLSSCSQRNDLLYYQNSVFYAECTLNGEYKITILKSDGEYEIGFTEPTELSHILFKIGKEPYVLCDNGDKIPLPSDKIDGIYAICGMLELSEDYMTNAVPADGECAVYSFLKGDILYEITYNKHSLPIRAEITSSELYYEIKFDAIKLS